MTDVDRYIAELDSCLHVGRRDRARILAEVRDHLDDAIADRQRNDAPRSRAVGEAVTAFGSPLMIATRLNAAAGTRAMRRAPFVAFSAGVAVFAGFLVAGTTQPHASVPTNANLATQISFFLAVLAFQVAVVAGVCAMSRVLASWRTPTVPADDRALVHRCTVISTGALGVAAAAWALTMRLGGDRLADPNVTTLVLGAVIMIAAAIAAIAATHRLHVNASDDTADVHVPSPRLFGIGETAIGLVRRHPLAACLAIAAISAVPTMSHAETTLAGALPWGAVQAATVILSFIALGPALGLRNPSRAV